MEPRVARKAEASGGVTAVNTKGPFQSAISTTRISSNHRSIPRITRSAAKQSSDNSGSIPNSTLPNTLVAAEAASSTTSTSTTRTLRKRKAPVTSASVESLSQESLSKRRRSSVASTIKPKSPVSRERRKDKKTIASTMSEQGMSESSIPPQRSNPSKRKSTHSKKLVPDTSTARAFSGHAKKSEVPTDDDTEMADVAVEPEVGDGSDADHDEDMGDHSAETEESDEDGEERYREEDYDEDDDEVFDGSYLGGTSGANGLSTTLRALSGLVSGISTRFRDILESLRQKEDPSTQIIALQELSELLLVSTEENLSGHFSPDQFIKELVSLMQDQGPFGENPDMMLLACRCIANLMEALPAATANVVYGGAVPVLCAKLMEIQYIDLAEQSLSTLEKISVEYPTSIVREGGLTACLTYLDFFATNVQRTAVTTAANCCRNIPADCFVTVRDVMPILLGVLGSSDQKVVEQGCQCVARIAESFRHHPDKLEQLLSKDILKVILQLLLPGTTNLVGSHIHTQFLRVLAITAKASPTLSIDLLKMNIVDTLFQILTGISPPVGEDPSMKNSSVMTMQALIHKPREQIFETLNVICEILPEVPIGLGNQEICHSSRRRSSSNHTEETPETRRRRLLKENTPELRRFASILLPTLTDAYTSTVNLSVRQKVLTAQLRMISNVDTDILKYALSGIQFASHLATILSQQDQHTLIVYGLQAAELLLRRLPDIYRYHFHREGVITEIEKLSAQVDGNTSAIRADELNDEDGSEDSHDSDDNPSSSPVSSRSSSSSRNTPLIPTSELASGVQGSIIHLAKKFLEAHQQDETVTMKQKAKDIMHSLTGLAQGLRAERIPTKIFEQLATYFNDDDSLQSISSFELLSSGIVEALLHVLEGIDNEDTRRSFLQVFMLGGQQRDTPFSVLVKKLQDLLSRSEHFEVVTVHQNYDGNRSSASMLAKQLRLKLVADNESDIPKQYRGVNVSIHAIATFKALDDYLRPRIFISERPKNSRTAGLSNALAAFAAAAGLPPRGTSPGSLMAQTSSDGPSSIPKQTIKKSKSNCRNLSRKNSSGMSTSSASKLSSKDSGGMAHEPSGQERLECMDEQPMPDEDQDMDEMGLDDLDRNMEDRTQTETSAVNMEVTGGKVTARKDDGTRVATPSGTPGTGPMPKPTTQVDYATATQLSTNDWHIEFSINNHLISNDMTIYKAVQLNRNGGSDDTTYRNIWSAIHPVKFQRVPGPAPPDAPLSPCVDNSPPTSSIPASLDNNKITSSILKLLSVLHALNANIDDVFQDMEVIRPQAQPLSQFVNTKLTAKLNRQLEEPLIVASACLPSWSEDLARFYPFIFPFETRHLYLQSTSFGYSRSMTRWQNSQQSGDTRHDRHRDDNRPFLGRLQRQKVRISRERILESAIKVMEIYGASPSMLEVEYFEEVGTGLGPTLEFYSSVSRAFVSKNLKLWREHDFSGESEYTFGQQGLFPAPISKEMAASENGKKLLHLFKILGKFVARSMLDSRIIDIFFNPTFFRTGHDSVPPSLGAVKSVDNDLAKSLKLLRRFATAKRDIDENPILTSHGKHQRVNEIMFDGVKVEDLEIDFTLPGYPQIELIVNGSNTKVTIQNVGIYVDKVIDLTLGSGVQEQVEAFRTGFSQVFPYNALRSFTPDELVMLFGQVEENWSLETLMDSMKADHGFNLDSKTVQNLLQVMSGYNSIERREFLQFVTGSPKLPIGGFKALTPMLTVVCKASEPPYSSDDYLPSVMTCVNYLKLPDYSSLEILKERLQVAIKEGQGAFHLS